MSLKNLDLPSIIDTSSANMATDFYVPALAVSIGYDRGVGFFSSGWLRLAAQGMAQFAANGGRAHIITSPVLDETDWDDNGRCTYIRAKINERYVGGRNSSQ